MMKVFFLLFMAFFLLFRKNFLSFFLCVLLCVNHKFRYNCFICLFSDHVLVPRDEEKRKSTEHELEPSLVKNFLSLFFVSSLAHDIKSSLSRVLVFLTLIPLAKNLSLGSFSSRLFTKKIKYIFMYKAMQSMLMKTSAPSFSHAFLFSALFYAFFPFIFSVSQQ